MAFPQWLRFGFPTVCFALGSWQVYRLNWKTELIRDLERNLARPAIKLDALPYADACN